MEEDLLPGNDQQAAVAIFAEDVDFAGFAVEADWVVDMPKNSYFKKKFQKIQIPPIATEMGKANPNLPKSHTVRE
ncbi:hypothetical protein [Xanthomonas oryzae]|uniref:hypothetical protein n=1 Tax=Xanthomonas oryzae TaxID=347 RepID=UPI00131568A5|nr:hypothetical protein [Xanthomonas oryzae]